MQILSSTHEELFLTDCFSHTEVFRAIRTWLAETVHPHVAKKWGTGDTENGDPTGEIQLNHLVVYVAGPMVLPHPIGRIEPGAPVEASLEPTGRMIWLLTGNVYEDQRRLELPIDGLPTTLFAIRWDDRISEQMGLEPIYPAFPERDVQQIIADAAADAADSPPVSQSQPVQPQAVPSQVQSDAGAVETV